MDPVQAVVADAIPLTCFPSDTSGRAFTYTPFPFVTYRRTLFDPHTRTFHRSGAIFKHGHSPCRLFIDLFKASFPTCTFTPSLSPPAILVLSG